MFEHSNIFRLNVTLERDKSVHTLWTEDQSPRQRGISSLQGCGIVFFEGNVPGYDQRPHSHPSMFKFNLLVQVPLWQTVCGKNHTAARNPDWTAYPCLANKAENFHQWRRRTAQSDICHRWALIEQHQGSGQVWPVNVQHCLQSTDKLYSSRSWASFHKEAQTGTVQADGVCHVSWLVSNLVSCETHPCTFMHHYNHFTHFTLPLTCILVVQSHLYVHLLFSLTCFHTCLVLPSYTSNAQLTHI